jgi:hypothetical protein
MKPSQKRPSDYEVGDHIGIVNLEELHELCTLYSASSALSAKQLNEFANHHVQIHWLPNQHELRTTWDGCIEIITKKKKIYKVPFAAIIDLSDGIIEEPEDDNEPEMIVVRDSDSENLLVQQLAAETIQSTFRFVQFLIFLDS